MWRAPILRWQLLVRDQLQEAGAKESQVFPVVKIVKDLSSRSLPDPVQPAHRGAILPAHQFLKEEKPRHKILQIAERVEKACFPGNDDFRDSRDRGHEHDSAPRHPLHKYERKTFAAAPSDNYVGAPIV